MVLGVLLVLHRDPGDRLERDAVGLHIAVHLEREDPEQVDAERAFGELVIDRVEGALRVGHRGGHLLLREHEAGAEGAAGDMPPAGGHHEDARAAADIHARVGLALGAGAVEQVLALQMDAVESVGGAAEHDAVDVGQGQAGVVECRGCGLPAEFATGFQ